VRAPTPAPPFPPRAPGGLFPFYKTAKSNYASDRSGIERHAAFLRAVEDINNRTDILPRTRLVFAVKDSKRDGSTAFIRAVDLCRHSFAGLGADAIVGPASSGPSAQAALITRNFKVPQVSYSATSSELSKGAVYEFFGRVVPSDSFQGQALAHIVKQYGWTRVALVSGDSAYGVGGNEVTSASHLGF
jgi:ABC-type branched-subunit amino acid transport system substrate-binding protein